MSVKVIIQNSCILADLPQWLRTHNILERKATVTLFCVCAFILILIRVTLGGGGWMWLLIRTQLYYFGGRKLTYSNADVT